MTGANQATTKATATPLQWSISLDDFLPPDLVYMARTDLRHVGLLGFQPANLEMVTGIGLGMLGKRHAIRHRSCVTDELCQWQSNNPQLWHSNFPHPSHARSIRWNRNSNA